jgi:glycosyltransferase involved in cell wall biosynthesis
VTVPSNLADRSLSGPRAPAGQRVTPVILTRDEEANIGRTLEGLAWADDVVIVDSGSTDATERIARGFPRVRWFVRPFDTHAQQWEFAIHRTGVKTDYVLALDADYGVTSPFVAEMEERFLSAEFAGGVAGFEYRLNGRPLAGSVYPAKVVLFRPDRVHVSQPGHTQEIRVDGPTYNFAARLVHDDRKPLERFVTSQLAYARLEAARLSTSTSGRWQDRLRRLGLMPVVAGLAAYFRGGGPFNGRAARRYAYERILFESLLALRLDRDADDASHKASR